ncbi:hypothetical protein ACEWY4_014446 [Coilia grayii]|uniref:Uncharacterized protein n=1 Tax=Coilia grayii TaxID=363190 RepID=A0ABD1JSA2_9TELE
MFENSTVAQQQRAQSSRSSARRSFGSTASPPSSLAESSSLSAGQKTGGSSQHLKNALNLGKAVGAKVNDLLRRKDPNTLGDIGVTEVNKNVGAVWSCVDGVPHSGVSNSHASFEGFPRLDPPPPTGKKRVPRALKTTRDMMISSDPVVASPEASDCSFPSSPDKAPLIVGRGKEGSQRGREGDAAENSESESEKTSLGLCYALDGERQPQQQQTEEGQRRRASGVTNLDAPAVDEGITEVKKSEEEEEEEEEKEGEDQSQLPLSVPDLIHKDTLEPKQKLAGSESRLASTPCPGKAGYRISVGEDLLENGSVLADYGTPRKRSSSVENEEPHPDLLSFE